MYHVDRGYEDFETQAVGARAPRFDANASWSRFREPTASPGAAAARSGVRRTGRDPDSSGHRASHGLHAAVVAPARTHGRDVVPVGRHRAVPAGRPADRPAAVRRRRDRRDAHPDAVERGRGHPRDRGHDRGRPRVLRHDRGLGAPAGAGVARDRRHPRPRSGAQGDPGRGDLRPAIYLGVVLVSSLAARPLIGAFTNDHRFEPPAQIQSGLSWRGVALTVVLSVVVAPIVEETLLPGRARSAPCATVTGSWPARWCPRCCSASLTTSAPRGRTRSCCRPTMMFTGLGLAALYEWRGNIVANIAAHMAFNTIGVILIFASSESGGHAHAGVPDRPMVPGLHRADQRLRPSTARPRPTGRATSSSWWRPSPIKGVPADVWGYLDLWHGSCRGGGVVGAEQGRGRGLRHQRPVLTLEGGRAGRPRSHRGR